jgi:predicted phosphodiesterase
MPLIGILSDAHGNIDAFCGAIDRLRSYGVESCYFLGDAVGYIPSLAVLRELQSMGGFIKCILGNHDRMLLQSPDSLHREAVYQHEPVRKLLSTRDIDFLRSWPTHRREVIGGARLLFVHGSPNDFTNGYVYPDTDLRQFHPAESFVFMGHTHYPFIRSVNGTTYVNVGSCGLPRDDGRYGAFAIFDSSTQCVKVVRYSIAASASALCGTNSVPIHTSVRKLFSRRSEKVTEELSS